MNISTETGSSFAGQQLTLHSPRSDSRYTGLIQVFVSAPLFPDSRWSAELSVDWGAWAGMGAERGSTEMTLYAVINGVILENGARHLRVRVRNERGETVQEATSLFTVANSGRLASLVRDEFLAQGKTWIVTNGLIDSRDLPAMRPELRAWFDRPEAHSMVDSVIARHGLPEDLREPFHTFIEDGYLELPEIIDPGVVDTVNADLDRLLANGTLQISGTRIHHLFLHSSAARSIWRHALIHRVLQAIFDDEPVPCQTLNFISGSEQGAHQDTIHLAPFPEGYMCGVWVALEDVHPDAGPLWIYPGSHRSAPLYANPLGIEKRIPRWDDRLTEEFAEKYDPAIEEILEELGHPGFPYLPKKGSALIWHTNLIHAGSVRTNRDLTRKSMVSHFFARGCAAFYDSTGTAASKQLD